MGITSPCCIGSAVLQWLWIAQYKWVFSKKLNLKIAVESRFWRQHPLVVKIQPEQCQGPCLEVPAVTAYLSAKLSAETAWRRSMSALTAGLRHQSCGFWVSGEGGEVWMEGRYMSSHGNQIINRLSHFVKVLVRVKNAVSTFMIANAIKKWIYCTMNKH